MCFLHFLSFSTTKQTHLPQCHSSKAKTIKVYKYVNTAKAAHQEEQHNDIFCPRLANPQDTSKLETLMTTYKAQMVKLWGHAGPSDAAQAACGHGLPASTDRPARLASMHNPEHMQRACTHMHVTPPDATPHPWERSWTQLEGQVLADHPVSG